MTATSLKHESSKELHALLETLAGSIAETLSSLVGRKITVRADALRLQDAESILEGLPRTSVVARGAMSGAAGASFLTMFELPDAVALAGLLMMTPEDVINQRRSAGSLQKEDAAAFGELGSVLYSSFGNTLNERFAGIELELGDHGTVEPKTDSKLLGKGRLVTLGFRMKLGEYPESTGLLAIELQTAEQWNKAPLEFLDGGGPEPQNDGTAAPRADDDGLESIPEAPIRGVMSAFILQNDVFRLLRRSCRRVGLELRRHGRAEIPNPAAHRNQIVVLDVMPGEDRRFDWCRRIKDLSDTTKVMLLIHHPSRQRVTQAFLSGADSILGFPCEEMQLSQKLNQLIASGPDASEPPSA